MDNDNVLNFKSAGALVQCRKKGAKNWGNKSKKKK